MSSLTTTVNIRSSSFGRIDINIKLEIKLIDTDTVAGMPKGAKPGRGDGPVERKTIEAG